MGSWDYQYCTNHFMPFSSGSKTDMSYPKREFNPTDASKACEKQFGVSPEWYWARTSYGGLAGLKSSISNIVFSNGLLDPWSAGGVRSAQGFASDSVKVVIMPFGAHHSDLMFANEKDTPDVKQAREIELKAIQEWIDEARWKKEGGLESSIA